MFETNQNNQILNTGIATLNPSMPVDNSGIVNWLGANPGATDATIAQTMQQYGVTPEQMAAATGMNVSDVTQRYSNAIAAPTTATTTTAPTTATTTGAAPAVSPMDTSIQNWFSSHPGASDIDIAQAMQQYGITPDQVAAATGVGADTVSQRYNTALSTNTDIKDWLAAHPAATDIEIAQAMNQYGINPNQVAAATGLSNDTVTQRYKTGDLRSNFIGSGDASDLYSGILSGMKYAHDKNISDSDLKTMLGDADYNKYKQGFADYTKNALTGIMADNSLSFDEAANVHKFAKEYGLTNEQLAAMTGYKKELFDKFDEGYNTGLSTLVGKFKGDTSAATPAELKSNIGMLLGAQQKYGLTDADLAAASGGTYTTEQVTSFLDPIRNVGKTLTTLSSDPNATGESVLKQLQDLKDDRYIGALYGDKLDSLIATASKDYSGNYGGKDVKSMNPLAVSNVLGQLKAEQTAAAQSGTNLINGGAAGTKNGGFGSADAVLEDMAKNLVASGITDIRQVGQVPVTTKVPVVEQDGVKGIYINGSYDDPGTFVPLDETQLKSIKNGQVDFSNGQMQIVNKETGKPLLSNYSERTGGNMWSGTFAGDGNTGYGVQFNKDGLPIFYTQGASSSSMADVAPLLSIASFIPGVAPFAAAANALLSAYGGNYLGALASLTGAVPGLSEATGIGNLGADTVSTLQNVSSGLRIADSANRGDWLGAATGAANMGGFGGIGDIKIGDSGLSVGDALKGMGVLGALNSGDYLGAAYGAADLGGVKTIPGTNTSLGELGNVINMGRAVLNLEKDPSRSISTLGRGIIGKAKGGLLQDVTPDKVRASARNADPAYFQGIASNLMRTA